MAILTMIDSDRDFKIPDHWGPVFDDEESEKFSHFEKLSEEILCYGTFSVLSKKKFCSMPPSILMFGGPVLSEAALGTAPPVLFLALSVLRVTCLQGIRLNI